MNGLNLCEHILADQHVFVKYIVSALVLMELSSCTPKIASSHNTSA